MNPTGTVGIPRYGDDMRWSSLFTVFGGGVVALVGMVGLITGHVWAALPLGLGLAIAVREVRYLQRLRDGRMRER